MPGRLDGRTTVGAHILLGHPAQPSDPVSTAVSLEADDSDHVTGHVIPSKAEMILV